MSVGVSKDADAGVTRRLPSSLFAIVGHTLRTVVGLFAMKAVEERQITMLLWLSRAFRALFFCDGGEQERSASSGLVIGALARAGGC